MVCRELSIRIVLIMYYHDEASDDTFTHGSGLWWILNCILTVVINNLKLDHKYQRLSLNWYDSLCCLYLWHVLCICPRDRYNNIVVWQSGLFVSIVARMIYIGYILTRVSHCTYAILLKTAMYICRCAYLILRRGQLWFMGKGDYTIILLGIPGFPPYGFVRIFYFFFRRQGFRMITFDRQAGPLQNFNRSHVMVIGRSVSFFDPARPKIPSPLRKKKLHAFQNLRNIFEKKI